MKHGAAAGLAIICLLSFALLTAPAAQASLARSPDPGVIEPGPATEEDASPEPTPRAPEPTVTITVSSPPAVTPPAAPSSPAPSLPPDPALPLESPPALTPPPTAPSGQDPSGQQMPETPLVLPAATTPPVMPLPTAPSAAPTLPAAPEQMWTTTVSSDGAVPDGEVSLRLAVPALMLILTVIAGLIAVDRRTPKRVPATAHPAAPRERHIGQHRAP
ncbi:hypothetical protein HS041_28330 [Planomonospora sp. ID67723]|uniref:hypothetical protein n=1 Tax=Planomonospora sp. ID67723 TaxID=2738134 RepID=UPI0018C3E4CE|nr:hypothetical protein [Planomonospora sp. ID67723]MBG0831642.1 hypothetical protein [Planomonospora sp. ID67723]